MSSANKSIKRIIEPEEELTLAEIKELKTFLRMHVFS